MKIGSYICLFLLLTFYACSNKENKIEKMKSVTAAEILGNKNYQAIAYGGYRTNSRRVQPTVNDIKEDLKLLAAMNIKVIRTYNVHMPHAVNVLKAINELVQEDENFEMYVMLGAWIDCKNAWTGFEPNHNEESERNATEIEHAVELANQYPHIVKIIAVGNEAMVKWAAAYYVQPWVILKWVNHLQALKQNGKLPKDLWITSSDNFASWGGGGNEYHVNDLNELIKAVDYISLHTYPMHDTHYNPVFWGVPNTFEPKDSLEAINQAMQQALGYAQNQYQSVVNYVAGLGVNKPIHIGETGWASHANELYGHEGSKACDEYKQALFYNQMRQWTNENQIACFFFEAFDEPWKDAANPGGSENHFGLFTVDGKAKYALWQAVDNGLFNELKRGENTIVKTYNGSFNNLLLSVRMPPIVDSLILEN